MVLDGECDASRVSSISFLFRGTFRTDDFLRPLADVVDDDWEKDREGSGVALNIRGTSVRCCAGGRFGCVGDWAVRSYFCMVDRDDDGVVACMVAGVGAVIWG
ncbi:hypothetical protein Salat_0150500 [Sesamum alatum]|uniref:Uncharacterized protein n=1 Tax=Sesamum alatum TaxID=300844 RepID=A0AAE1YYL0_9LAMI|nr:hypothetical protein Salat_0150500 [Sesamum alatum]